MGGDFRQTSRNNNVMHYCMKNSVDLHKFVQLLLLTNMHACGEAEVEFDNFLLNVATNTHPTKSNYPFRGCIALPQDFMEHAELLELTSRVILTPRNNESLKVNDSVPDRHHGEAHVYYSADVAGCPNDPDAAQSQLSTWTMQWNKVTCGKTWKAFFMCRDFDR